VDGEFGLPIYSGLDSVSDSRPRVRIGILETGYPPAHLADAHGSYPDMFRRFIGEDAAAWQVFDVQKGQYPSAAEAWDAVMVTGSPAGVYDPYPWIGELIGWLQAAKGRTALVGVCFGHQVMAAAFGGQVRKSEKGWGLGLHTYRVIEPQPWMDPVREITAPVSHQDQVVALPPTARVVAASDFTPHAVLAYADQPAISFQCHPEFTRDYAIALAERRRGQVPDDQIEAAKASLEGPNDDPRIADWVRRFLRRARQRAAA
jgi:GMP synthase-like glutamine amidotransferase